MIYYFVTGLSMLLAYFLPRRNNSQGLVNRKTLIVPLLASLPFLIVTCFRYQVGTDYFQYVRYYEMTEAYNDTEPLFLFLVWLCKQLWNSPYVFIGLLGFLFCYSMFALIYQRSENVIYSIFLFMSSGIYLYSLSMMRQCIALSCFFVAFYKMGEGKNKKAFFWTLVSIGFHKTSIVYLLCFVVFLFFERLYKRQSERRIKSWSTALLAMLFLLSDTIRELVYWVAKELGIYVGYFGSNEDAGNMSITHLMFALVPFVFALFSERPRIRFGESGYNKKELVVYDLYYWGSWMAMLFALLMPVIPNGERMIVLFSPLAIFSIPYFSRRLKTKGIFSNKTVRNLFVFGLNGVLLFATHWYFIANKGLDVLPFHFL